MRFCLLRPTAPHDDKIPFETTEENPGDVVVRCEVCGARTFLPKQISGRMPVEILIQQIGYLEDIEQAGITFLGSAKFREAVRSAGLTGIEFYPLVGYKLKRDGPRYLSLLDKARNVLQYEAIEVTGRADFDIQKSGMVIGQPCPTCRNIRWEAPSNGYHINESRWDGSDFFYCEVGPVFITERAVSALKCAGLSNFGATPAEEFRNPIFPKVT
jgi:hypothetical protein